ncbi:hypothetical protein ACQPTN_17740 [Bradyrhizobium sp. 13971]
MAASANVAASDRRSGTGEISRGGSFDLPRPSQDRSIGELSSEASRDSNSRQMSTAARASLMFREKPVAVIAAPAPGLEQLR